MQNHAGQPDSPVFACHDGKRPPPIADYELLRGIGQGAYGEVWLGRNVVGAFRAIKIVYRSQFDTAKPYEREFEGMGHYEPISRTHEGLMDVLHVGRSEAEGYFYYVMELADDASGEGRRENSDGNDGTDSVEEGGASGLPANSGKSCREGNGLGKARLDPKAYIPKTLKEVVKRRGRLSCEESLRIGLVLAAAADHLHKHHLVHRDIKPSNVIFVDGQPKLADIGLVAEAGERGSFVGTEGFVAPEGPGEPPADVFSLGKLLYEISTGRDRNDYPDPISQLAQEPDQARLLELNAAVLKACEPDPAKRYQTMEDFRHDLAVVLADGSIRKLWARERRWRRMARVGLAAGVVGLAAASIVGSYLSMANEKHERFRAELALKEANLKSSQNQARLSQQLVDTMSLMASQRMEELLATDRTGEAITHLARVVRQYPENPVAVERLVSALTHRSFALPVAPPLQHDAEVYSAQFSPEGSRVITASRDGTARVWDARTGQLLTAPLRHKDRVHYAEFSSDGSRVVTASWDHSACVWDPGSGRLLVGPLQHEAEVWFAQFSPAGDRVVTASADSTARIWDVTTGKPITGPLRHAARVNVAQFSPDGRRLVTASEDGTARIWDAEFGQPLARPMRPVDATISTDIGVAWAEFSPDGQVVVTADDRGTARLWATATGELLKPPLIHSDRVRMARFSPDGFRVVTASWDGTARVWDARTGKPLTDPLRHRNQVRTASFSSNGLWVVTASRDQTVRIWDAFTGEPVTEPIVHSHRCRWAAFSPDSQRIVTGSEDQMARILDIRQGGSLPGSLLESTPFRPYEQAEFSPDGTRIIAGSAAGLALIKDVQTSGRSIILKLPDSVGVVHFSPNGTKAVIVSGDCCARVFDAQTGQLLTGPVQHTRPIAAAEFSPDGTRLATASFDKTAQLWDARTGARLAGPLRHGDEVWSVRFSPDGSRVVTASLDKTARIWDAQTGRPLTPPLEHAAQVHCAEFSPDGEQVVTASNDRTVRLWDVRTGQLIGRPLQHGHSVLAAHLSPDGRRIASITEDNSASIWDAQAGERITNPLRHQNSVRSLEFSPDSQRILTGSNDRSARIWDVQTGQPLSEPLSHAGPVACARFSPDGRRVLTASSDGSIRVWEVARPSLPAPKWLPELAEVLVGDAIARQDFSIVSAWERLARTKWLVSKTPTNDFWARWGNWFFADRGTRTISPFSPVNIQELVNSKIRSATMLSLREALRLQPTNPLVLAGLVYVPGNKDLEAESTFMRAVKHLVIQAAERRPPDRLLVWTAIHLLRRLSGGVPEFDETLVWVEGMIQRDPSEFNWWIAKGFILEMS